MKSTYVFLITILTSLNIFAGLELGVYEGSFGDEKCIVGINNISFTGDVKHPLNEKVQLQASFSETEFTATHLPVIDLEQSIVAAEKAKLKAVIVTADEVEAIALDMEHSDTYHGPVKFSYYLENRLTGEKSSKVCNNLKKI